LENIPGSGVTSASPLTLPDYSNISDQAEANSAKGATVRFDQEKMI